MKIFIGNVGWELRRTTGDGAERGQRTAHVSSTEKGQIRSEKTRSATRLGRSLTLPIFSDPCNTHLVSAQRAKISCGTEDPCSSVDLVIAEAVVGSCVAPAFTGVYQRFRLSSGRVHWRHLRTKFPIHRAGGAARRILRPARPNRCR